MPLRTLLVAALAVAGLAVPPAAAAQSSEFYGDCGFDSVNQRSVSGPDTYQGALYVYGAVYGPDLAEQPVSASVTCYIRVDGVAQPATRMTLPATGVVAGAAAIAFEARADQLVELCLEVDFLSDDTPTYRMGCGYGALPPQIPPRVVTDLVDLANDVVIENVDPAVCPPLVAHTGTYGPVTVAPDGDVDVADSAFWDCPPYEG